MFIDFLTNAGLVGLLSLLVGVLPLANGVAYAVRPSDARLALLRPLSLATLFAAFGGSLSGIINVLRGAGMGEAALDSRVAALGLAEAMVPMFVAFGFLTVAWLCAAYGLRSQP